MPDALTTDGLHPDPQGYSRMYAAIDAVLPAEHAEAAQPGRTVGGR
jgi:lysophospholipase L1-like esterase